MFSCPECRESIADSGNSPLRCGCGAEFPILPSGGIDFLRGREFPDFRLDPEDATQQDLLAQEAAGVSWRVESFILPMLRRYARSIGKPPEDLLALDCGCGSGMSVEILGAHAIRAIGIDAGESRHLQWRARARAASLHSADALRLPFADGSFDAVLSSGLVEHIGIHEEASNGYRSHRLSDCGRQRTVFVSELVRVLKPDGFILLDHPNGACPMDFWHGTEPGVIRWHTPFGDMLPRFSEIAAYFRAADPSLRLVSLSPIHRLRFHQVSRHWYGRALAPLAAIWLKALDTRRLSPLSRSFLNPYLVTLASRDRGVLKWAYP